MKTVNNLALKSCRLLLGAAALTAALQCRAAIIVDLEPSSQTINTGDTVAMDLVISGLGNFSAPSLGGFDFDLSYDPSVLSASTLVFGNHLDLGILGSLQNSSLSTPGVIHLDEVSFESSSDLHSGQPSSFTLATLDFKGVGAGLSTIDFTSSSLSDESGQSLGFETKSAQVKVNGSASGAVPDAGSSVSLMAISCFGLWMLRRAGFASSARKE